MSTHSSNPPTSERRALEAPSTPVTYITTQLVDQAVEGSRSSSRKRMILPLHKSHDDTLHRMFNAMQPGTYIPPHRHVSPPKAESIVVLRGALCFVTFDDAGNILQMTDLVAGADAFGVDVGPGTFHTFFILDPDTVMFEVKSGPYSPIDDKDFASWAPREGQPGVAEFQARLKLHRAQRT